jgi:hypothetical protein
MLKTAIIINSFMLWFKLYSRNLKIIAFYRRQISTFSCNLILIRVSQVGYVGLGINKQLICNNFCFHLRCVNIKWHITKLSPCGKQ